MKDIKRFGLVLPGQLYNDFYRLYPDHGERTRALRRCVYRMVQRARALGSTDRVCPEDIADQVQDDMEG